MQVGEQFAAFPSFMVFETFGKEVGDMGDRSSWGDDKLDLNANRRTKEKKMPRRRSLRLRAWDLGLMFPCVKLLCGDESWRD